MGCEGAVDLGCVCVPRELRCRGGGLGHEKDEQRPDMFPFALSIVFCHCIKYGMTGTQQLSYILIKKLKLLPHNP